MADDLMMTANVTFTHNFTREGGFGGRTNRLQVRDFRGSLLIELTAFLTEGEGELFLEIPGSMVATLPAEGVYDLLSLSDSDPDDGYRTPKGRAIVDLGVTSTG